MEKMQIVSFQLSEGLNEGNIKKTEFNTEIINRVETPRRIFCHSYKFKADYQQFKSLRCAHCQSKHISPYAGKTRG